MKALWKSFILFWVLTYAYQRKLFHKFWSETIAIFASLAIKLAEYFNSLVDNIKIPTNKDDDPMALPLEKLNALLMAVNGIQERTNEMALSLHALAEQVDRASSTQSAAVETFTRMLSDMQSIQTELAAKAAAAENSVDASELQALVDRLKTSTDTLAQAIAPPAVETPDEQPAEETPANP